MKKYLILIGIINICYVLSAQTRPCLPEAIPILKKFKNTMPVYKSTTYKDNKNLGDTIVYDDFSSGGPGSNDLPTGWTTQDVDTQGNNYVWQWTDIGAVGPNTAGYEHVLASTSAANGWMILDSDNYGLGSYDAQLISPTYDLSDEPLVTIVFEELYQRWGNETANPYGANPTFVGVSTDGGTNWIDIEVHADFETYESTDNPGLVMLNVTALVANQSAVKIRFRMQGYWDYWWQIDDFHLIGNYDNDTELAAYYVSQIGNYPAGSGLTGFYSLIPTSQAMDTWFRGDVRNKGSLPQHIITLNVNVTNASGISFYNEYVYSAILFPGQTEQMETSQPFFTAPGAGNYFAHFTTFQDETDEFPGDNTSPKILWTVSDNKIMAHDVYFTRAISPEFYTDGTDGDMIGCSYHIENATTVKSISVFIDYRTDPGTTIIGQIYTWDGTAWNVQIVSEEHAIVNKDLGTWIELPLIAYNPGEDALNAQSDYIAGCEFYYGTQHLWIGADDEGPHLYNLVTNLRLGTTYYWIHELPMIRLNLSGAVVPPVFTTYPDTFACKSPFVYEYTAHVTDAGGATCSFTLVQSPNWLTLVDNNNNSATLTGTAPTTATGQSFLIEIEADNGTSKNQQWYVLDVLNTDTCWYYFGKNPVFMDSVSIFPNPANDVINISNAVNSDVSIYSISGKIISSFHIAEAYANIGMSGFDNGVYLVRVIRDDISTIQKIILIK